MIKFHRNLRFYFNRFQLNFSLPQMRETWYGWTFSIFQEFPQTSALDCQMHTPCNCRLMRSLSPSQEQNCRQCTIRRPMTRRFSWNRSSRHIHDKRESMSRNVGKFSTQFRCTRCRRCWLTRWWVDSSLIPHPRPARSSCRSHNRLTIGTFPKESATFRWILCRSSKSLIRTWLRAFVQHVRTPWLKIL